MAINLRRVPLHKEVCSKCNCLKAVSARDNNEKPLCRNCEPMESCSRCKKPCTPIAERLEGGAIICKNCYKKDPRHWEKCSLCGKESSVEKRTEANEPICRRCYIKT